ncbi:MAG: xanthine dehydrogenase family protein molybdopterin-binding subunit [Proteobacteria bacterium]|nr:xanthine dehydrogenase family protein molybdopterin-binding subunit [Burkholderiales bacterium]
MPDHAHAPHAPFHRKEDRRLVTGHGLFTADRKFDGELHAVFLRSDRAHANIVSLDLEAARSMPGVHGVFTAEDGKRAGMTQVLHMLTLKGSDGQTPRIPPRGAFADARVRFVGEPIAMVVAESVLAGLDALEAIQIEYEDLPHVIDAERALAPGAPQLHECAPDNMAWVAEAGDSAAVDAALAAAATVVRLRVDSTRIIPNPMEPRTCAATYDATRDHYHVYSVTQGVNMMKRQIAVAAGVREDQVTVHAQDVGGSFGNRSAQYPEHCAVMLAAKALGRPIRWIGTRSECLASDYHGRSNLIEGQLAVDGDGRFTAIRLDWIADMGAFLTAAGTSSHTRNPVVLLTGVYKIAALHGRWRVAFTNTSPIAAYRGAGRPDVNYVIERLVDEAAAKLGLDPADLRRRNLIGAGEFPYKTPTGSVYEATDVPGSLEKAVKLADWDGFKARRAEARARGKLRGIGMASFIENTGAGVYPKDQVDIEVDAQGRVHAYSVAHSQGQGHETTFTQVIAEAMGVDTARVFLHEGVPDRTLIGNHTGGSRSLVGAGSVCKLAGLKLIEVAKSAAAAQFDTEPSQVEYHAGTLTDRASGKSTTLAELAQRAEGLRTQAEASIGSTFPTGCHIAEVEIDMQTGFTEVLSYVAVDDCGFAVNHTIVEGQVHGGILQGFGQVFGEKAIYDEQTGQLMTGSFMDYAMPRAGDVRHVTIEENCVPSKINSLGAKGVGESGCTGSISALANAMADAMRPLGGPPMDMPFTPSRVWHAIGASANAH